MSKNDNKYDALCCRCIDDDDGDESISLSEGNSDNETDSVSNEDDSTATEIDAVIYRSNRRTRMYEDTKLSSVDEAEKQRKLTIFYHMRNKFSLREKNGKCIQSFMLKRKQNIKSQIKWLALLHLITSWDWIQM